MISDVSESDAKTVMHNNTWMELTVVEIMTLRNYVLQPVLKGDGGDWHCQR